MTVVDPSATDFVRNKQSKRAWFRRTGWRHLVALAALAFALFPVLWVVSAAFASDSGLARQSFIPEEPSLDNFRALMTEPGHPPFWRWFLNSMLIGTVTAGVTVFLCALGAYAFSRLRFRGRRPGMLALLQSVCKRRHSSLHHTKSEKVTLSKAWFSMTCRVRAP